MQIGVNYLLEVKELFEEGKIDFMDYFKLFSLNGELEGLEWCTDNRWLMFHGTIGGFSSFANTKIIETIDIDKMKEVIEKTRTPYISGHIYSEEVHTQEEYLEIIKQNIKYFRETFGKKLILENTPLRKNKLNRAILQDPEFISKIVYDNDIGFLFDISHARASAKVLNMTLEEYVSKLPMDKCVEIHLAGMFDYPDISNAEVRKKYTPKQLELVEYYINNIGKSFDNHGKMNDEDYLFLEKLLKEYKNIEYITLEYGSINYLEEFNDEDFLYPICNYKRVNPKAKEEVLEQLTRIKQIVNS